MSKESERASGAEGRHGCPGICGWNGTSAIGWPTECHALCVWPPLLRRWRHTPATAARVHRYSEGAEDDLVDSVLSLLDSLRLVPSLRSVPSHSTALGAAMGVQPRIAVGHGTSARLPRRSTTELSAIGDCSGSDRWGETSAWAGSWLGPTSETACDEVYTAAKEARGCGPLEMAILHQAGQIAQVAMLAQRGGL